MTTQTKTVGVAMSGGVDSSVAAALLKKAGYNVFGIFMHFWSDPKQTEKAALNKCCSVEAQEDARRVAQSLDIPFYTMNMESDFKEAVVDDFLRAYQKGLTPNPCVRCNKFIKLGMFLEKAKAMGADYIATGHYVRNEGGKLLKGTDPEKDQSYFLYNLTPEKLEHILFPVGEYTKPEVREMAKNFGLPVYEKSESQEICFVPGKTHYEFLKNYLDLAPGDIVTLDGEKIGKHEGLPLYTIGQRKGIGIGGIGPFYVVRADYDTNRLIVTDQADDPALYRDKLAAKDINWISGKEPTLPITIEAKIRYGHKAQSATLGKNGLVKFKEPQRAITSGQSVVFYKGDEVLGGGVIVVK